MGFSQETLTQEPQFYVHAEPRPVWGIVLMGIWSSIITALFLALFVLAGDPGLSFIVGVLLGGLACWSWYLTFDLYFRRRRHAHIYIAVTDTDFIYQDYDAIHRLKKVVIPRGAILKAYQGGHLSVKTLLYAIFLPEEMHTPDWQICIQYRDTQGKERRLWIDYDEFFPTEGREKLLRLLGRPAEY